MLILGVETSCDETAAGVVDSAGSVRSNVIWSQHDLHEEYGGVVPEIASRAHAERIYPVVRRACEQAGVRLEQIDAVAVGSRPGLIGSLVVGVAAAKALAWSLGTPLVGVDHVEAHLYAGALDAEPVAFPALGLVVSGGHSSLFRLDSFTDIREIGSTIDDAIGEAYDKVGSLLGLPFPGGPRLDRLAQGGDERAHEFPVSRLGKGSLDFSFSGLKTAVLYAVRGVPGREPGGGVSFAHTVAELDEQQKADLAASFQRAAVKAVEVKVERALETLEQDGAPARTLLVGGGVSANSRLRAVMTGLAERAGLDLRLPRMALCLDNAAMIAGLAHARLETGLADDLDLAASPRRGGRAA